MKEYLKGQKAIEGENYKDAVKAFDKVISDNKNHQKAFFYRGFAHFKLKDQKAAWRDFVHSKPIQNKDYKGIYYGGLSALALHKNDSATLFLATLYPAQSILFPKLPIDLSTAYLASKNYEDAIKVATAYVRSNPRDLEILQILAHSYAGNEDWEKARQYANKALYQEKENVQMLLIRSKSNLYTKSYEAAFNDANLIASKYPKHGEAYFILGKIKENNRDFNSAIRHYHHTKQYKKTLNTYLGLGLCHLYSLNADSAIYYYELARKIESNYEVLFGLGVAYQNDNKQNEAIRVYNSLLEKHPNDSNTLNNRASCKASINDITGAINDYNKAIQLTPKFEDALINLAILYGKERKYEEALELLNKVILFHANSSIANYLIALNNEALGNGNCADFQRAYDLGIKEAKSRIEKYCGN